MHRRHIPFIAFDSDAGAGGGGGSSDGGQGGQGAQGAPPAGQGAPPPAKEFEPITSQAKLDEIIGARLARHRPAGYDELAAKARKWDDHEAAQKPEAERVQTQITTLTSERDAAQAEARELRIRSAVVAEAARKGAVDPDDVYALLVNKTSVTIGDDGQVNGVAAAVKATLEAKPHLVGTTQQRLKPDPGQGAGNGTGAQPSVAAGRERFEQKKNRSKATTTSTT